MAKSTTDPDLAAKLVDVAAELKEHAGELPGPDRSPEPIQAGSVGSADAGERALPSDRSAPPITTKTPP